MMDYYSADMKAEQTSTADMKAGKTAASLVAQTSTAEMKALSLVERTAAMRVRKMDCLSAASLAEKMAERMVREMGC